MRQVSDNPSEQVADNVTIHSCRRITMQLQSYNGSE